MASIGARYGFDWRTLWDHPRNAQLKSARKDPNILFPGDVVLVPAKQLKEEPRVTDARHRFVMKCSPEVLRIRVLNEFDRPLTNLKYELTIGVKTWKGVTNDDGEIKVTIAPAAAAILFDEFAGDRREGAITLQRGRKCDPSGPGPTDCNSGKLIERVGSEI